MNTTSTDTLPPLISRRARVGIAVAAVGILSATLTLAGHASRDAVKSAQAAISPTGVHIVLPTVVIAAPSGMFAPMAETTCPTVQRC